MVSVTLQLEGPQVRFDSPGQGAGPGFRLVIPSHRGCSSLSLTPSLFSLSDRQGVIFSRVGGRGASNPRGAAGGSGLSPARVPLNPILSLPVGRLRLPLLLLLSAWGLPGADLGAGMGRVEGETL